MRKTKESGFPLCFRPPQTTHRKEPVALLDKIKNKISKAQVNLISFTSVLLVFLLGAVVVMGSLIYQFANGSEQFANPEEYIATSSVLITDNKEVASSGNSAIVVDVNREVIPSIVVITNQGKNYVGVIVSSSGVVVIPYAAIDNIETNMVTLASGEQVEFTLLNHNEEMSFASINISTVNLRPSTVSTMFSLVEGDEVYIFGCIDSAETFVSKGTLSDLNEEKTVLQTDAPLGDALVNIVMSNSVGQIVALSDGENDRTLPHAYSLSCIMSSLDIDIGLQSLN